MRTLLLVSCCLLCTACGLSTSSTSTYTFQSLQESSIRLPGEGAPYPYLFPARVLGIGDGMVFAVSSTSDGSTAYISLVDLSGGSPSNPSPKVVWNHSVTGGYYRGQPLLFDSAEVFCIDPDLSDYGMFDSVLFQSNWKGAGDFSYTTNSTVQFFLWDKAGSKPFDYRLQWTLPGFKLTPTIMPPWVGNPQASGLLWRNQKSTVGARSGWLTDGAIGELIVSGAFVESNDSGNIDNRQGMWKMSTEMSSPVLYDPFHPRARRGVCFDTSLPVGQVDQLTTLSRTSRLSRKNTRSARKQNLAISSTPLVISSDLSGAALWQKDDSASGKWNLRWNVSVPAGYNDEGICVEPGHCGLRKINEVADDGTILFQNQTETSNIDDDIILVNGSSGKTVFKGRFVAFFDHPGFNKRNPFYFYIPIAKALQHIPNLAPSLFFPTFSFGWVAYNVKTGRKFFDSMDPNVFSFCDACSSLVIPPPQPLINAAVVDVNPQQLGKLFNVLHVVYDGTHKYLNITVVPAYGGGGASSQSSDLETGDILAQVNISVPNGGGSKYFYNDYPVVEHMVTFTKEGGFNYGALNTGFISIFNVISKDGSTLIGFDRYNMVEVPVSTTSPIVGAGDTFFSTLDEKKNQYMLPSAFYTYVPSNLTATAGGIVGYASRPSENSQGQPQVSLVPMTRTG